MTGSQPEARVVALVADLDDVVVAGGDVVEVGRCVRRCLAELVQRLVDVAEVMPRNLIRIRGECGPLRRAGARAAEDEEDQGVRVLTDRQVADTAVGDHAAVDARVVRDVRHTASLRLHLRGLPRRASVDRAEAAAGAVDVVEVDRRRVAAEQLLRPRRLAEVITGGGGRVERCPADCGDVPDRKPACSPTGSRQCRRS